MASNRRKYFRRTRKTRMRDLKHSPTGILSFCTAMAALAVFLTAVVQSFLASGEGGYKVGGLGLIGLILALGALLCGIFAVKEPKIHELLIFMFYRWSWRHVHIRSGRIKISRRKIIWVTAFGIIF